MSTSLIRAAVAQVQQRAKKATETVLGNTELPKPQRRLLVLSGLIDPTCAVCVHFDLEVGQAAMKGFEAFAGAAGHLSPEQMARADDAGRGEAEWDITGPKLPAGHTQTRWSDYGACQRHNEIVHKGSSCKEYT